MDEALVVAIDEAEGFGIQLERGTLVVDCLNALKQLCVQENKIVMCRELRASAVLTSCSLGLVFAPVTAPNAAMARSSNWPLFSSATMVFSNVGASGLLAMASISAFCCSIPASIAG